MVSEVTALHSGAAAEGIRVACEVGPDLPPIYGDEEELRRVLLNLVSNAMDSIKDEGEVRLSVQREDQNGHPGVRLSVADTGVGIPEEHRDRLFEPHFSTKTSGTGLGLAIVSRIVQDMGGQVAFESRPGGGARFMVWLPGGEAEGDAAAARSPPARRRPVVQ